MQFRNIIIICFVYFSSYSYAQNPVIIDDTLKNINIGSMMEYLEDKSGSLDIKNVASNAHTWNKINKKTINLGFSSSVYFFRFTIDNKQIENRYWYFGIDYPLIDYIDLYQEDGKGGWIIHRAGDHYPFEKREIKYRNFIFKIKKIEGKTRFFMRIKTSSSINFTPSAVSIVEYSNLLNIVLPILWIYYGLMIIMVLYNFFLFFSMRSRQYLYYSLSILFFVLFALTLNGYSFQYLWPKSIWWANNSLSFFICLAIAFVYSFIYIHVDFKNDFPRIGKIVLYGLILPNALWGILSLFLLYKIGIIGATLLAIVTPVVLYIIVFYAMLKKNRAATFIVIGYSFLVIGMVLYTLKTFGILEPSLITNWAVHFGSAMAVLLASLSIADEINSIKNKIQVLEYGSKKEKYIKSKIRNLDTANILKKLEDTLANDKLYLESDLTLQKCAVVINITTQQLSEIINLHYKMNFNDFINSYRINDAKKILSENKSEAILEICYKVGFNSSSAFYRAFKKETGITPKEFEKNIRKT